MLKCGIGRGTVGEKLRGGDRGAAKEELNCCLIEGLCICSVSACAQRLLEVEAKPQVVHEDDTITGQGICEAGETGEEHYEF